MKNIHCFPVSYSCTTLIPLVQKLYSCRQENSASFILILCGFFLWSGFFVKFKFVLLHVKFKTISGPKVKSYLLLSSLLKENL